MENNKQELLSKVANLESKVDMLETELNYLNEILKQCGFPEGTHTLKMTVEDLLVENPQLFPQRKMGLDLDSL